MAFLKKVLGETILIVKISRDWLSAMSSSYSQLPPEYRAGRAMRQRKLIFSILRLYKYLICPSL